MNRQIHYLKTVEPYFSQVKDGIKTFEVRYNDRDFRVGDILVLQKWDKYEHKFAGPDLVKEVKYMLDSPDFCKEGFVILGI